jgi:hypothetical protein
MMCRAFRSREGSGSGVVSVYARRVANSAWPDDRRSAGEPSPDLGSPVPGRPSAGRAGLRSALRGSVGAARRPARSIAPCRVTSETLVDRVPAGLAVQARMRPHCPFPNTCTRRVRPPSPDFPRPGDPQRSARRGPGGQPRRLQDPERLRKHRAAGGAPLFSDPSSRHTSASCCSSPASGSASRTRLRDDERLARTPGVASP